MLGTQSHNGHNHPNCQNGATVSIGYDPQADPLTDVLRRAANGDEAAKAEFHRVRAVRAKAHAEFERTARENAWTMIRRARSGNTGDTAA